MMLASVKDRLHEYIEHADEKKIQAIYTLVENDLENRSGLYDAAALAGFQTTSEDYISGTIKGYPMEESLKRIREKLTQK